MGLLLRSSKATIKYKTDTNPSIVWGLNWGILVDLILLINS